jgi:hypothetical protein
VSLVSEICRRRVATVSFLEGEACGFEECCADEVQFASEFFKLTNDLVEESVVSVWCWAAGTKAIYFVVPNVLSCLC